MVRLPEEFCSGAVDGLCEVLESSNAEVSIRINGRKMGWSSPFEEVVQWCEMGRYVDKSESFTLDPIHAGGGYYVQEASSMAVGEIVRRVIKDEKLTNTLVVDLCAAPGGKSTHISSVVGSGGVVVANEVIGSRAGVLAQNVVRWGDGNTVVTSADGAVLSSALEGVVDILVIDAPCSGEGMFRKEPKSIEEWSMEGVELCASRQRRIVSDAKRMLSSGGYLIYSTCTYNRSENEDNVEWLLSSGEFELCGKYTKGLGDGGALGSHFYPHKVRGEGLFVAVMRYVEGDCGGGGRFKKVKTPKAMGAKQISMYSTESLFEIEHSGNIYGYSELMCGVVDLLRAHRVRILHAGVKFGELIRGELKPAHDYALYSSAVDIFPTTELPLDAMRNYMRKGVLDADNYVQGLQQVTYSGLAVGFAKRIGGRVNNLYPTSWRIINL